MLKGTTKSGFKYEIKEETLNDYELFELISEVDEKASFITETGFKIARRKNKKTIS